MKHVLLSTGDALDNPKISCVCETRSDATFGSTSFRTRFPVLFHNGKHGNVIINTSSDLRMQLLRVYLPRVNTIIWTPVEIIVSDGNSSKAVITGDSQKSPRGKLKAYASG